MSQTGHRQVTDRSQTGHRQVTDRSHQWCGHVSRLKDGWIVLACKHCMITSTPHLPAVAPAQVAPAPAPAHPLTQSNESKLLPATTCVCILCAGTTATNEGAAQQGRVGSLLLPMCLVCTHAPLSHVYTHAAKTKSTRACAHCLLHSEDTHAAHHPRMRIITKATHALILL